MIRRFGAERGGRARKHPRTLVSLGVFLVAHHAAAQAGAEAGRQTPPATPPSAPVDAKPAAPPAASPQSPPPTASPPTPPSGVAPPSAEPAPGASSDVAPPSTPGAPAEPTPAAAAAAPPVAEEEPARDENTLKYILDDIEVRGNTRTRARVVLRYVPFRSGDVIDVDDPKVTLTKYRLLGTGFFREVQLALRKGNGRGHVVLIIEVVERNTLIVNDLWMGLAAGADTTGNARPLSTYAGLDAAETNLAGTGITLGGAVGIANDQFALRVRFFDPAFLGSEWMTTGTLLYNHADDFFGNSDVKFTDPLANQQALADEQTQQGGFAVVQYQRFGGTVGVGRDLSVSTQLWANYRLEGINASVPLAATDIRGRNGEADREPIDFDIVRGASVLSTISATLQHDTRDKPFLTNHGWFASVTAEVSLSPFGSDYPYSRVDFLASHWWTLPFGHVLRLRLFGGAISGRAPFFERYYASDFSDFRAPRELGLNVERRPAPNFFDTDIVEIRRGDYAAKLDVEYRIPLYHGTRSVYGIDVFARAGFYAIAGQQDIVNPPGGYSGAALIPIDFTANLGVQIDTSAGGFTFALANVLGFIPALSEGR